MRLCAIDVGTNTVQSLVADVAGGHLAVVADEERFARLGQGVDASGRLAPEAIDRVVDRLAAAQATARRLGALQTVIAATSASRDASNVGVLRDRVRRELGLDYHVVAGEREAALSFAGALAMAPEVARAVVVDVGGGSTEVVAGARGAAPTFRLSLDVGSVRLTERRFAVRPPTPAMVDAASADVAAALAAVPPALAAGLPVLATGSVARVVARLTGAEGASPVVAAGAVRAWRDRALGLTPADLLAVAPDVLRGREDVAAAAVLVLDAVLAHLGAGGYVATPGGLRHGLALEAGGRAEPPPGLA